MEASAETLASDNDQKEVYQLNIFILNIAIPPPRYVPAFH